MANPKFDNNMRGVLFKEELKEKDNGPDYGGSCEIAGVEYWISAWVNTAKTTQRKFMSLKFRAKDPVMQDLAKREISPLAQKQAADFDDEIPF